MSRSKFCINWLTGQLQLYSPCICCFQLRVKIMIFLIIQFSSFLSFFPVIFLSALLSVTFSQTFSSLRRKTKFTFVCHFKYTTVKEKFFFFWWVMSVVSTRMKTSSLWNKYNSFSNPLKHSDYYIHNLGNSNKNFAICWQYIYVFQIILGKNSNYFPIQKH